MGLFLNYLTNHKNNKTHINHNELKFFDMFPYCYVNTHKYNCHSNQNAELNYNHVIFECYCIHNNYNLHIQFVLFYRDIVEKHQVNVF